MKHFFLSVPLQILFFTSLFICGLYIYLVNPYAAVGMTSSCQTISDPSQEIRSGYGSPFNFFSNTMKLAVQVLCSEEGAQLTVGTGDEKEYVLEYAYRLVNKKWQKIELTGDKKVGNWYIGSAQALLDKATLVEGEKTRIIAYVCQNINNVWRCGCRDKACATPYWQIQEFQYGDTEQEQDENTNPPSERYIEPCNPSSGVAGTQVMLTGKGFSLKGNTVLLNDKEVAENVVSKDGNTLSFTIPADMTTGLKSITVVTEDGEEMQGGSFLVTMPNVSAPVLRSVSPESGEYGEEVTVYGENFSKESNDILVGYDVFKGVPSEDGTSITFKMEPLRNFDEDKIIGLGEKLPVYIYVINEGGVSQTGVEYLMEI